MIKIFSLLFFFLNILPEHADLISDNMSFVTFNYGFE